MSKKRILKLFIFISVSVLLTLCVTACTGSDKGKVEKAIALAKERAETYRQSEAALADTVMYLLPEVCVYDCDEELLIRYNGKNYTYSNGLRESKSAYTFYSTLAEALAASPEIGQTVYTLGYHKPFDGGCARYYVGEKPISEIFEKSGDLYFNYLTSKKKVSLPQMGWSGEDIWSYQKRFEGFSEIDTLVFPKGEYVLCDVVRTDRDNVSYYGIEATVYSSENFGGATNKSYDALWNVRKAWSSTKTIVNQTYSGISFELRNKTYNTSEDVKGLSYLMQLAYCQGISVYNCKFYVPKGLNTVELKKYSTHCVDCYTAWRDVTFDGCSFENYSYANYGGAIGFRDIYNLGCENLTFTNNLVVSSARDEGVALFAGWDKHFHPDAELGNGYIRNCLLENNTFKAEEAADGLDPRTMFLTVGYQLSPVYNIRYINNSFEGYCNSYFLHYCYCEGLLFKGNTVNIRQSGDTKRLTLVYHNDSPHASDIVVEDNIFNLSGENFKLYAVTVTSPYSDMSELTFINNTVNLPDGYAETLIASDAIVKTNVFNMNRVGSIYYRTCGEVSGNAYNIGKLEKSVYEFYNANVKHDLRVSHEDIAVSVAVCNMLMFNGSIKFNGRSLTFDNVRFGIERVEKDYYYISWSSEKVTDSVVPITFKSCSFGAFEGHLQIPHGDKHELKIE